MKDNQAPKPIFLKDYCCPDYLIDKVDLTFQLYEQDTVVQSRMEVRRNPESMTQNSPLELDGGEVVLVSIKVDGQLLTSDDYRLESEQLIVKKVPDSFVLEIETTIQPQSNTRLEGLYKSNGMFCTQCEAQGFRHITYFMDRPDVMSRFTTRIEADQTKYPVLLSNGNPVGNGELEDGRHWVSWEDPFKKPCYLFALVAGDLVCAEDRFTTCSNRNVDIRLYVEPQDLDKCDHAIDSLKNAMTWDEEVYGREYDLDIYMIVAVSHFNMGAMENKGLNIFNTSCVLANPLTTTDAGFQRVEGVVAHEYFHNWSGNRVTCRDWFQLSLKEGFTVFRDEQFSSDMGCTIKRIEDVTYLKTYQFAEDAGPMAHPIRPESYIEMNNFYTTTVYQKGAEVVRMIHTLVGEDGFRKGCDLYFERHDGEAVTCDDFVKAIEEANQIDLGQFRRWYQQAGTPELEVSTAYEAESQVLTLNVSQYCGPTPGQDRKEPFYIPLRISLFDAEGAPVAVKIAGDRSDVLYINQYDCVVPIFERKQSIQFEGVPERSIPSLLRNFSAPVKLNYRCRKEDLAFLVRHDSDGFSRWDAAQKLVLISIKEQIQSYQEGGELALDDLIVDSFEYVLRDENLDKSLVASILRLPSEAYLVEETELSDTDAIFKVRQFFKQSIAAKLEEALLARYEDNKLDSIYQASSEQIACRSLKNVCLDYLCMHDLARAESLCFAQLESADNMTDESAALRGIVHQQLGDWRAALEGFYNKWKHEPLVVDLWIGIQASSPTEDALDQVKALRNHAAFEQTNPNKVRALYGTFANGNLVNFHQSSAAGYQFHTECILAMNKINPQIAARLVTPLTKWSSYNLARQKPMCDALKQILAQPDLSNDVYEIVSKSLAD